MIYCDCIDAGKQLAARLSDYANRDGVVVLALPRGGVPVESSRCQSRQLKPVTNIEWA